ncbi:hypothetical protein [Devosia sp.]|uniref:hypothetical protein n=1 Tax=Devosia sp. TaxID=1871048 RepID=UPI00326585D9
MRKTINGKILDTATAEYMCGVACNFYGGDFAWHDTDLYRSKKGQWFLAGEGNCYSMWGRETAGGFIPGEGIRILSDSEALRILEAENADHLIEEYFKITEG